MNIPRISRGLFCKKKPLSAAPEHTAQQTKVPTQKESAGSRSFSCFQKKVKAQNQQHAVFTVKNANFEAR